MKKPKERWTVRFIGSIVALFTEIVRPPLTISRAVRAVGAMMMLDPNTVQVLFADLQPFALAPIGRPQSTRRLLDATRRARPRLRSA